MFDIRKERRKKLLQPCSRTGCQDHGGIPHETGGPKRKAHTSPAMRPFISRAPLLGKLHHLLLPPNQPSNRELDGHQPSQEMEDFYYFPSSLETSEVVHRGCLPVVHSSPRNRSSPSPRPRRGSRDDAGELGHHYLDACFRCGRTLAGNKDIFMYR